MVCVAESFNTQAGLTVCPPPDARPVDDNRDVSSGSETDSDPEDEGDAEGLGVAETSNLNRCKFSLWNKPSVN